MYYQKKVVRKSLYPKAIDSREQRAKWACLHAHLATAARGNNPVDCSEVVDFRLRNKCGNEQETIWKEEKTQEEKDEAAYDCVSVEDNRHIDTSYNDNTYGLRMCNDTAPVTSMENNAPGVCVVVDAGHGGSDGYCEISLIESVSERRNYFEQGADGYYNGKANTSSADTIGNDKGGMVK